MRNMRYVFDTCHNNFGVIYGINIFSGTVLTFPSPVLNLGKTRFNIKKYDVPFIECMCSL